MFEKLFSLGRRRKTKAQEAKREEEKRPAKESAEKETEKRTQKRTQRRVNAEKTLPKEVHMSRGASDDEPEEKKTQRKPAQEERPKENMPKKTAAKKHPSEKPSEKKKSSKKSSAKGPSAKRPVSRHAADKTEVLENVETDQTQEELERRKAMITALMQEQAYIPMKLKELAILLNIPKEKRRELNQVLNALLEEGRISISKKGKYGKPDLFAVKGVFCGHPKGFGFVAVEDREKDVFIPGSRTNGALHGDTVLITVDEEEGGQKAEGTVIRILEHANQTLVGTYEKSRGYGFVVPDSQKISRDIFIPEGCDMGAVSGHKVVVRVKDFGEEKGRKPEGVITEILGHINDPGTDILSVVRAYDLPEEFPDAVMEELKQIPDTVTEEERKDRIDLRNLLTVTIDGEEAKDLDDAITLERLGGGYRLGVHIADVSHYVREGSALDKEALRRGTSVYLTDRVIPMLPHKLSNGICSLNQGEDRLALSCLMDLDDKGNVIGHEIEKTVIRVDRRMTYTAVEAVLAADEKEQEREQAQRQDQEQKQEQSQEQKQEQSQEQKQEQSQEQKQEQSQEQSQEQAQEQKLGHSSIHKAPVLEEYSGFVELFKMMRELADIVREKRHSRGAIDFDFPESKIILDEKGIPIEIKPYERNAATRIIEDFMLLANETVAEDFFWREVPFLYRTHEKPDEEKMKRLGTFINNFGYILRLPGGEVHPKEVQKLLDKVSGSPEEALISRLTLRSMKQAKYTTLNTGHFGLAARYYTHFTSPIRRYPDLQIHRIISEILAGSFDGRRKAHYEKILPDVSVKTSALERRADEAERETDKLKKVQYMEQFVGQEFDGVISGVTNWGFYVELPNTVEGLVHMTELKDDYYMLDEEHYELIGEMTRRTYKLGQAVRVQVEGCDRFAKTIDFIPVRRHS